MQLTATERVTAYYHLTKPGITRMVLITTAVGFYVASRGGIDVGLLLHTLLGTALAASGTNALNQWVERTQDGQMLRTAKRPLPSGRLSSSHAAIFAWGISLVGMAYLTYFVNVTTAVVVALSLSSYVFIYTPLKRKTWISTLIGAVPGALPILAGWTATGEPISRGAWVLFAILFIWQMPHFYALAWIYREDYSRAGFQMLTVVDATGRRAARHSIVFTAILLPISVLPVLLGMAGLVYFIGATILGFGFLVLTTEMWKHPSERVAWRIFAGSIIYLPVLLLLMVIDKV